MAFDTYSEISSAADQVEDEIKSNIDRYARWKAEISSIASNLTNISNQYGPIVPAVEALLTANPTDAAVIYQHAHIQRLLSDFNNLQAAVSASDATVNSPPP